MEERYTDLDRLCDLFASGKEKAQRDNEREALYARLRALASPSLQEQIAPLEDCLRLMHEYVWSLKGPVISSDDALFGFPELSTADVQKHEEEISQRQEKFLSFFRTAENLFAVQDALRTVIRERLAQDAS